VAAFCFIDLLAVSLKVFSVWQPRKASASHYSATIIGEGIFGNAGMSNETLIRNINTTAQPIIAGVDGVTVRLAATARYEAVNAMLLNEFPERGPQTSRTRSNDYTAKERDGDCSCPCQRARFKNPKGERSA
jgi:hypothetical protein